MRGIPYELAGQNLLRDSPARAVLIAQAEDQVPLQGGSGAVYGRVSQEGEGTSGQHRENGGTHTDIFSAVDKEKYKSTEKTRPDYGGISGLASHHHRRRHHREGRLRGTVHECAYSLSEGDNLCTFMGLSGQCGDQDKRMG